MEQVIEQPAAPPSVNPRSAIRSSTGGMRIEPRRLADVESGEDERMPVAVEEFSRVMGGGIVPGSITLIAGEPGIGKCLAGSTRVLDPLSGDYLPITEWANSRRHVLSMSEDSLRLSCDQSVAFHENGIQPVVEVRTKLGRTLRCTLNHPVYTPAGWQPIEVLACGSNIAAPRELPYFGSAGMPDEEVKIIAYILSDGSAQSDESVPECIFRLPKQQLALFLKTLLTRDGSVYVTSQNTPGLSYSTISKWLAEDVQHLLLRFGLITTLRTRKMQVNSQPAYEVTLLETKEMQRLIFEIGIIEAVQTMQRLEVPVGSSIQKLGAYFQDPYFERLADNDLDWDQIVSITPAGEELVYDISVKAHHNFVANDLIVHNSTLLVQIATVLAQTLGKVLYVSGEESARQIKMRADRLSLKADDLFLVTETSLESILDDIQTLDPKIVIVDSIQTTFSDGKPSAAGTVTQVRECAARLQMLAKSTGIAIFLVGHVTKEGTIAGPRVLEHIVDTVLYLEGDPFHTYRLLRSVKNRFGATSEVGVFEMRGSGLVEVTNPSEVFLAERVMNAPGSGILVTMEGTRPLLVEVQALASPTAYPNPRRTANGVDTNRLQLLSAVLSRRVGLRLAEQDIFVNVIGGLTVDEPAADLAVAATIASSYWDAPIPPDLVLVGEIGLSGELRAVGQLGTRLKEAAKLGFKRALVPKTARTDESLPKGIQTLAVRSLYEALAIAIPRNEKEKT